MMNFAKQLCMFRVLGAFYAPQIEISQAQTFSQIMMMMM